MVDPKIKYDIEASATGEESIAELTKRLEHLAGTMGGELARDAAQAAARLRELTAQQEAISQFHALQQQVRATSVELSKAEQEATNFARQVTTLGPPTAQQAGHLLRLRDATEGVRARLAAQREALRSAESGLTSYGISTLNTQTAQTRLRTDAEQLRESLGKTALAFNATAKNADAVGPALDQAFRVLGIKGVKAVETEIRKLQTALAQIRQSPDVLPADKAAAVAAFNARLADLRGTAQQVTPALAGIAPAANTAGTALAGAAKKAVAWATALAGVGSASDIVRDLVATGSEFENLRVRLDNLLGSTDAAEAAFAMIKDLAATTPFEVSALTESFVRLTAFGMQPTEAQMRALSDVAANLGGGTEALTGVTTALGQAWTKGKLQGEEILQMAERGVPVWDALATATGRSVPELQRMSSAGELGRDVIRDLIDELGRMNTGSSERLMKRYAGTVSNAKDALAEFYDMVAQSGVLDYLTGRLQDMLAEFDRLKDSGELEEKAKAIADAFVGVAEGIDTVVTVGAELWPVLSRIAQVAAAMKVASWARSLVTWAAGLSSVAVAGSAAATGVTVAGLASDKAALQMGRAAVATTTFARALRGLLALSGVGVLLIAIEQLVARFMQAKDAARDSEKAVRDMLATDPPRNAPAEAAAEAAEALARVPDRANDAITAFDHLVSKGDLAGEALGKIGKDFDLARSDGIRDAAQVLGRLVDTGRITAHQFRDAWTKALKDVNLAEFEVRARQAMDGVVDGARTLQQAIDAGLREALRRAGGDFEVLSGGMSEAAESAIQDVDFIIDNLERLKDQGVDVGEALMLSLGRAIDMADSRVAVEAVTARLRDLGIQGRITGEQLDSGLERARQRLDTLTKGVNSLAEAYKVFGLTSREELRRTADNFRQAWDRIRNDATLTLQQKQQAFRKYAQAAIEANGGVVTSELKVQGEMLNVEIAADKTGRAVVRAADDAGRSIDKARQRTDEWGRAINEIGELINQVAKGFDNLGRGDPTVGAGQGGWKSEPNRTGSGQLALQQRGAGWEFDAAAWNLAAGQAAAYGGGGSPDANDGRFWKYTGPAQLTPQPAPGGAAYHGNAGWTPFGSASRTVNVNLNVGGQSYGMQAPERVADEFMRALELAQRSSSSGGLQ